MWQRMQDAVGEEPAEYTSTHPSSSKRMANFEEDSEWMVAAKALREASRPEAPSTTASTLLTAVEKALADLLHTHRIKKGKAQEPE